MPTDLSLGHPAPLLPVPRPGSAGRNTLQRVLPSVEDAREAADNAGRMTRLCEQIDTDPPTGLGNRRGLSRHRRVRPSGAIVVSALDHS